jgi:hypothetical protein
MLVDGAVPYLPNKALDVRHSPRPATATVITAQGSGGGPCMVKIRRRTNELWKTPIERLVILGRHRYAASRLPALEGAPHLLLRRDDELQPDLRRLQTWDIARAKCLYLYICDGYNWLAESIN